MIETALVYIRKADETNEFVGCGTLVEGPYIATCRHVWRDADGEKNGGVVVEFPRTLDEAGTAENASASLADACDHQKPLPDLILLSVTTLPTGVMALTVAPEERFETGTARIHAFIPSRSRDVFVDGVIKSGTVADGLRQISGDASPAYWTEKGSGGSPAFIGDGMQLAGILRLSETGDPPIREAFILPGSTIRRYLERLQMAQAAAKMGVNISILEQAIPGLDLTDTPLPEIPAKIAAAVAAITAKAAEAPASSNAGADIDAARAEAAAKLDGMDTDGALTVWDKLLEQDRVELESLTRRKIAMLNEKASIHILRHKYSDALITLRKIIQLDPDDSASLDLIGDVRRVRDDLEGALKAYEEGLVIRRRLMAADPSRAERPRDVLVRPIQIGDLHSHRNDLQGALKDYREGLEIRRGFTAVEPSRAECAHAVSVSLDRIGDVRRVRDDLEGALTAYEEGLEIRRRLMAADPTNAGRARDVSVSLNRIGDVRSSRNELQGALRAYEEGLEIRRGLMAADPSHSERARDVFISLANIGLLHRQGGDKKAACRKFREALPIITALAGSAPGIYQLQQDFADIQRVIAETGCSPS